MVYDVLGFLPRFDLNNDMLVSQKWHDIIEGGGSKLPQLLTLEMRMLQDKTFFVEFSHSDKKFKLSDDQDPVNLVVLKNCIVANAHVDKDFEDQFCQISKIVGRHQVPIKHVEYHCIPSWTQFDPCQELAIFNANFSSMFNNYLA